MTRDRVYAGVTAAKGSFNVSNGALVALDRKTGKVRWAHIAPAGDAGNWSFVASPAVAGDTVFAADLEGNIYAFKSD